ncbi:MAG TPA: HypC/HybG/HupF family hydrogenase formation chaperone [Solirubrobacteraceae bacterium]|nr:HypC/HybG/HupF family hydrogenase formation chaperone [Solirubrobacteraceae bacterium]
MCVGSIVKLVEIRDERGVAIGRLEDGCLVPLSLVPEARAGDHLLLHLGIPVEILHPEEAREALALRQPIEQQGGGGS